MAVPNFVGIDVVDPRDRRCVGKARDERFLARVLAETERGAVGAAPDPDATLWRLWAAKEAAFKVITKVRGAPPVFVHAAFRVDPPGTLSEDGFGRVEWEGFFGSDPLAREAGSGRGTRVERPAGRRAAAMFLGKGGGPRSRAHRSAKGAAREAERAGAASGVFP